MAASANDLFMEVGDPGTATTLSAPGYIAGGTSMTVGSTSNWPTATGVIFAVDEAEIVDGEEVRVDGTYNEFEGTVASATGITNVDWVRGVGDRNYSAGALTRVYIVVSAERENRLAQGMLVEHSQTGTHTNVTATSVTATTGTFTTLSIAGTGTGGGWDGALSGTVTAVTNNGNRNYDLTTSADNQALISPGMRLRTTRTVAAPTQCATFDGVNDYFSKTTPAGMTFTDDFVAGAWVKLSSYAAGSIVSRYNGTSGWELRVDATGQIVLSGYNAAAGNYRNVTTYQSIPLNKWVHISAQLDMSAFTATTTTCYVMIDGVDVPCSVVQAGTNPTALIQAGDFCVGSRSGGSVFFPGKIAQAFVSSAKITQANVKLLMSQGLTSALITANNIISAYSFNNAITDLNTTNANNLTANGGVLATTADSPFGGQAGGTISSTLDYGIVAKVTASTITVNVAEGCTIPTSGGVSAVSYSTYKSPYGFPGQKGKWQLINIGTKAVATQSSPVASTWYNVNSWQTVAPLGEWQGILTASIYGNRAAGANDVRMTLSTANNTQSDLNWSSALSIAPSNTDFASQCTVSNSISTSAATTYYVNLSTAQVGLASISILGDRAAATLILDNAYL